MTAPENPTKINRPLSDFLHNASPEEKQNLFNEVIAEAIKDQQAVLAKAERINREREHHAKPNA